MAFGFRRKEILEGHYSQRIMLKAPFAFALEDKYKTREAMLYEVFDAGLHIRISIDKQVPILHQFQDIPMSFTLPGDPAPWNCRVDVERIYAYDEKERPVYGIEVKLKHLTKEQKLQLANYLQARKDNAPRPTAVVQTPNPR